jgi:hypothetical protein
LVFALIFDVHFDGAAVGLIVIPHGFDLRDSESVLAARNAVWQAVSPPTGGEVWVRKLWQVRRYAERIVRVTRSKVSGDSTPSTISGEIKGEPPVDAFLCEADVAKAGGVNQDTLPSWTPGPCSIRRKSVRSWVVVG